MQPQIDDARHKFAEARHVVDRLRLDKLRARRYLLGDPHRAELVRRRERVFDRADEEIRGDFGDGLAVFEDGTVAHHPHHPRQVERIDVVDCLGMGMVAHDHVIPAERQHRVDAKRCRADQVRLQRQPVAVAAGELEHRLQSRLLDHNARRQTRHVDARGLVVGGVVGVRVAAQLRDLPLYHRRVRPNRRADLRGYREVSLAQHAREIACACIVQFHGRPSSTSSA